MDARQALILDQLVPPRSSCDSYSYRFGDLFVLELNLFRSLSQRLDEGFERKSKELESFIADQFAEYNDWTFAENNNGEKIDLINAQLQALRNSVAQIASSGSDQLFQ